MAFQEFSAASMFTRKTDTYIDKSDKTVENPIEFANDIHVPQKQEPCKLLFSKYEKIDHI